MSAINSPVATSAPVCAVTGGSQGIGLAIVEAFLALGMIVFSLDIVEPKKEGIKENQQFTLLKTNVANPDELTHSLQQAFDQYQKLDCLVNNAAVYEWTENGNILWNDGTTTEQINNILMTNLGGVIHGTQAAYRLMIEGAAEEKTTSTKEKRRTIVNISSMGAFRTTPQRAVYGSTKAAILHFSHSADYDLSKTHNIRVFCVCPGIIDTEMGRMGGERNRQAVAKLKGGKRTPPELVAEAVLGLVLQRHDEWETCSYIRVDDHEITAIQS